MKKILAALTVPGLLLGGAAVAGAQSAEDAPTEDLAAEEGHRARPHRGLANFAEALGLTGEEMREALADGQTLAQIAADQDIDIDAVIADIVAEAQERADANPDSPRAQDFDPAQLEERLINLVNNEFDPTQRPQGDQRGRRGPKGPGGGAIAEALDLEPGELKEALKDGSTIADVAADQGVDINAVIDQIVADAEARVADNPDSRFAENFDASTFEERLTERVNNTFDPSDRPDRGHRGHRGGHRGPQIDSGVDA